MSSFRHAWGCALIATLGVMALGGCSAARDRSVTAHRESVPPTGTVKVTGTGSSVTPGRRPDDSSIASVNFEERSNQPAAPDDDLFSGQTELALPALLEEVRARNPSLQAALAAWGEAAEKHPQVVALDDPMLQTMFAPGSFPSSSNVQSSYYVGVAQKIPWPGKRDLKGQIANWQTVAASLDYSEAQLRLDEASRLAFFDYYLVQRQLDLTAANVGAVQDFRKTAKSRFEQNLVPQQDVLQADLELAKLQQRQIDLEQMRHVAAARINTLLHRHPDVLLPPPPAGLGIDDETLDRDRLLQLAVQNRPDLSAIAARLNAEQNAVALACKEFYPDFEFMGRYDSFWTDVEQRGQVGMNMNIPLNQSRRRAAVRESMFRVNRMQAEYNRMFDGVRNEVTVAVTGVERSRKTVRLYNDKTLPAAQDNVSAATSSYEAGTVDFLRLIAAQRELIDLQEKYQEAVAEYHRKRAELERVVATPPSFPTAE